MVHSGISLIFWLRYSFGSIFGSTLVTGLFFFLGFVFIFDKLAISYFTFKIHL